MHTALFPKKPPPAIPAGTLPAPSHRVSCCIATKSLPSSPISHLYPGTSSTSISTSHHPDSGINGFCWMTRSSGRSVGQWSINGELHWLDNSLPSLGVCAGCTTRFLFRSPLNFLGLLPWFAVNWRIACPSNLYVPVFKGTPIAYSIPVLSFLVSRFLAISESNSAMF